MVRSSHWMKKEFLAANYFKNGKLVHPLRSSYVLFDLLWDNGRDLTGKSVIPRRERLQEIITPVAGIQVGGYLEKRGIDLFQLAKERGLEGIIAKRRRSTYQPGQRSPDWLKIKSRPQQEFIACGFTEGKGSRKHFGALLLGAYRNGKLHYFGHSGTGFTEKGLADTVQRLRPFFPARPTVGNPLGRAHCWSVRWRSPSGLKTSSYARLRFLDGGTIRARKKWCYNQWMQKVLIIRVRCGIKSADRHVPFYPLRARSGRYFLVY